jgi:hypothetical protein
MQAIENCNVRLFVGRKVTLHNAEGMGDWPGRLIGITPEGALVECEDGDVRGADWDHITLGIQPDDFEGDQTDRPEGRGKVAGMNFGVKVGDRVQGCPTHDDDWIEGEVVAVCESGCFVRIDDDKPPFEPGEVVGFGWDHLLITTKGHERRELITA